MRFAAGCGKFKLLLQNFRKTKQEYSETEGTYAILCFLRAKIRKQDVGAGGKGNMKTEGKRVWGYLFLLFFLAAGWYLMHHFCAYVVLSGSMEPKIPTGAVIVVDGRRNEWNPGEVITYRRGNMVVTHRIVEKTEDGYRTKGDANEEEDAGTVRGDQVVGNVIAVLPWMGYGIVWIRQRKTLFFLAAGFVMIFTGRQLWHGRKEMEEKQA